MPTSILSDDVAYLIIACVAPLFSAAVVSDASCTSSWISCFFFCWKATSSSSSSFLSFLGAYIETRVTIGQHRREGQYTLRGFALPPCLPDMVCAELLAADERKGKARLKRPGVGSDRRLSRNLCLVKLL